MKVLTILLLLLTTSVFGQDYNPKIIVLDPLERSVDNEFQKEIKRFEIKLITSKEYDENVLKGIKLQKKKENEIVMEYKEYLFRKEMNYFSQISLVFSGFITYKLYNYDSNCLVFPIHITSSEDLENYKKLADDFEVDWLINPLMIKTYTIKDEIFTDIRIQLYNKKENKVLLDNIYTGSSKNLGFEWACEDGTIDCTVNNAQAQAIDEIMKQLKSR